MAKYKITSIDEAEKHITFEVHMKNKASGEFEVVDTQTRSDIPFDNIDNIKAALSDYAITVEEDIKLSRKTTRKLQNAVGKLLDAKTPEERALLEKEEVEDTPEEA